MDRMSQPRHAETGAPHTLAEPERLAIAISSQTGSGGMAVAQRLGAGLQANTPASEPPWTVFDRNLIVKVLEDHNLPPGLAKHLREDASSRLEDAVEELLGLHPPSWLIVRHSIDTVHKLVRAGNVILVGWGVTLITAKMPGVFHVRLFGSLDKRIARIQERDHLSRAQALALITRQDRGRERYIKRHFGHQITDPLLFHLIINTDQFSEAEAADLIAYAALAKYQAHTLGGSQLARAA